MTHHYSPLATAESSYKNRVGSKIYIGSREIFSKAYELIANANSQVLFQTWRFDHNSLPVAYLREALKMLSLNRQKARAKKPVNVWLLINVIALQSYHEQREQVLKFISKNKLNNQFVQINVGFYRAKLLGANHAKGLVIDNRIGLITGANLSNGFNKNGFFEAGFVVEGSIAHIMSKDFIQVWQSRFKSNISPIQLPKKAPDNCLPILFARNDAFANFSVRAQSSSINWALMNSVEMAEEKIDIFTPNLNAIEFQAAIDRAIKRGVRVRIILSKEFEAMSQSIPTRGGPNLANVAKMYRKLKNFASQETICNLLQIKWYSANGEKAALKAKGVNAHVKYMMIDEQISLVGSPNMDRQSWVNSREIGLFIDDQYISRSWSDQLFEPAFSRSIKVQECGGPEEPPKSSMHDR